MQSFFKQGARYDQLRVVKESGHLLTIIKMFGAIGVPAYETKTARPSRIRFTLRVLWPSMKSTLQVVTRRPAAMCI